MIRPAPEDLKGPIELFQQKHPRQVVGKGHGAEGEFPWEFGLEGRVETVTATEGEAKAFAEMARAEWNAEWVTQHKGSYVWWLWSRVRQASFASLLRVLFLIALVGVMLFYPLAYVFR